MIIKKEVSDGIIAPGYTQEALEILKQKKKGNYNIIEIDENYKPEPIEKKQVFGITFEQGRNEFKIDDELFKNIVSENKNLPKEALDDLIVAMITLKYTQSNSVCYAKDGQAIGIGAGHEVDGQVLVSQDFFGMFVDYKPKFVRQYLNLYELMTGAVSQYITDVKAQTFPNESEQY